MLEKWKQRTFQMNFKKPFPVKTDWDHPNEEKGIEQDIALITGCGIIGRSRAWTLVLAGLMRKDPSRRQQVL